jgi:hypothetical protein
MSHEPAALQLRYMQTLLELGSSQASTIVFPLPIDLLKPLLEKGDTEVAAAAAAAARRLRRPDESEGIEAAPEAGELPASRQTAADRLASGANTDST